MSPRFRFLSPLLLAGLAVGGSAMAQTPMTDAQSRYMGAYVFEKQLAVFRGFCAADTQGAQALEAGAAAFRQNNPDFTAALQARPAEPAFAAGLATFDTRFAAVSEQMRTQLAQQPAGPQCAALGQQLNSLRFATLLEEAAKRAATMQTPPPAAP